MTGWRVTARADAFSKHTPPCLFPPRKRKRRTDVVVVRGRLRLYSASGFFLLLGLVILAAGIAMATLGYWPHRAPPEGGGGGGGGPRTASAGGGDEAAVADGDAAAASSTGHDVRGE